MSTHTFNIIESSREEYAALPEAEWRKDYFNKENGGYVATHIYKERDDLRRPGIVAEVNACFELAEQGKHILRLPENIPELIDSILIDGKPFRTLLKFKQGETIPRGYPDAYFDGQTWDFKTSSFTNEDTLRHRIKNGRKADNVIIITNEIEKVKIIEKVINRELGMRKKDNSWKELPDVFAYFRKVIVPIWEKDKRQMDLCLFAVQ